MVGLAVWGTYVWMTSETLKLPLHYGFIGAELARRFP